jgi:hypothetical protein
MPVGGVSPPEVRHVESRTRFLAGIGLLLLGGLLVGVQMLDLVEVALVVVMPLAVLLLASGTLLLGTSDPDSARRPV